MPDFYGSVDWFVNKSGCERNLSAISSDEFANDSWTTVTQSCMGDACHDVILRHLFGGHLWWWLWCCVSTYTLRYRNVNVYECWMVYQGVQLITIRRLSFQMRNNAQHGCKNFANRRRSDKNNHSQASALGIDQRGRLVLRICRWYGGRMSAIWLNGEAIWTM